MNDDLQGNCCGDRFITRSNGSYDIDREYTRLQAEGVTIATPIETEPWGELFFQVTDPNGVVLQLVQWISEQVSS